MKRALLIGVPAFRRDEIPDLPVARHDVALIKETLHRTGYEDVRVRGADDPREATRNEIQYEINRLCQDAAEGDTLLVYISTHGLHHDGRDYLVPHDGWFRDPRDFPQYLVPIDLGADADRSRAHTIAVFIDACREGIDLGVKTAGATGWGQGKRERARQRHLVLCFACQPGEYAHYVGGDGGFSLFARALATVLDPAHPARSLGEVCAAAQDELDALARLHDKPQQTLRTLTEMEIGGVSALDREICAGAGVRPAVGGAPNPWTAHALAAELWSRESVRACPWLPALRARVEAVVDACWEVYEARPAHDPWTDAHVPGRAVDALGLLCLRAEPAIELNAGETALAVIAPFVHEAVLWSADPKALAWAVESRWRAHPQLARLARRLEDAGKHADAAATSAWIEHRARLRLPIAALPKAVAAAVDPGREEAASAGAGSGSDGSGAAGPRVVAETLQAARLFALSRCLISEPAFVQRDDRPGALRHEAPCGGHGEDRRVREKLIGYLLVVAGRLALDPRMLSDVVVEHLGLSDPVAPGQVLSAAAHASWRAERLGLVLAGTCEHPAVDVALREHVDGVSALLETVHRLVAAGGEALAPLRVLPVRAGADELCAAARADGQPGYELPHVSFHLSSHEVQELLMGEQLYGDPTLAIRELYQNALDACRYRHARLMYLERTGQLDLEAHPWEGRITFRQGVHEGRPYIECEDNGIGMDQRAVAECFARAGRRFHDSPEFIEEQVEWQRCDPPVEMFPNSQFGIGVFSYFMLADELELATCRLDRSGRPGATLSVHIAGSGSLFRIRPAARPMADAGTRVRLYLSRTEHEGRPISAYRALRRVLWVAEYTTQTIDEAEGGKRFVWRPGELAHPGLKAREVRATSSPHLWWVAAGAKAGGAILADGLLVTGDCPCMIVNLAGAKRPRLTVDRRRAIEFDRCWIDELASEHLDPLVDASFIDFEWLWKLAEEVSYRAADALTEKLRSANLRVRCQTLGNIDVPIAAVGCFPWDRRLMRGNAWRWVLAPGDQSRTEDWLPRHRAHAWWRALRHISGDHRFPAIAWEFLSIGHLDTAAEDNFSPEKLYATPLDAALLPRTSAGQSLIPADVPVEHIRRVASATGLSVAEVMARLRKFEPFGLRLPDLED